jgi:hypothetical protein
MERNPKCRQQTALELQHDLVAVREELAAVARAPQIEAWDLPTTPLQRRAAPRRALPPPLTPAPAR